jgi:hypothetical protein
MLISGEFCGEKAGIDAKNTVVNEAVVKIL